MSDLDKNPRWVVEVKGKRLYTYAVGVKEATDNFIAFGVVPEKAPVLDEEPWLTTLNENWSKARPG